VGCYVRKEGIVTDRHIASLLELDPDLGQLLEGDRVAAARHELRVAVHTLEAGPWDIDNGSPTSPDHIGLLILDGVLAREVLVSDTVSTELLGPGDIVRPWRLHNASTLLRHGVRWNVLTRSRVGLLDRRFAASVASFPEVNAAIIDRVNERALRLAVTQAISQLNRVDRRLLALLWHLAERWGRMTPDGVALPMTLSHRMLGQLIGARRPTVSTALSQLARESEVMRRDDGTWLLAGAPVGAPAPELERVIPMRRRLLPTEVAARRAATPTPVARFQTARETALEPVNVRGVELRAVHQRLREQTVMRAEEIRAAFAASAELAEHSSLLRERCRATRATPRRNGAAHL
jgi:CRP/FNR family transcriptional regulator, cyclic AMP receptor protein